MQKTGKRKKKQYHKVTWAHALRDIVITSMNRGQFLLLAVIGIIFIMLLRMPAKDVSKLMFSIIDHLLEGELLAYIVLFIVLISWLIHARIMRKIFSDECKRIGTEKSNLQSKNA